MQKWNALSIFFMISRMLRKYKMMTKKQNRETYSKKIKTTI